MKWELIVIPVITAIFTTIILYIKENRQNKKSLERSINEQKLKELYNKLFSISLIYTDRLEKSFFITPAGMFDFDGALIPEVDTESIHEHEVWDGLIKEIRTLIHEKLHLLDEKDLSVWNAIELVELEELFGRAMKLEKYRKLEMFLRNVTLRYKYLNKKFHNKK